jgi:hypothetical protein
MTMQVLRITLLLALLPGLGGCVRPEALRFEVEGYNPRLRGDRAALDGAQREADLEALRHGPWPTRADAILRPLTPAHPEAGALVQSDCWFMGRAPLGGGDAVRADWEAVALATGDLPYEDPEDGRLELGLCRFADPETRTPPLHRDRASEVFAEIDCGAELGAVVVAGNANLFRCREDSSIFGFRLTALRDPAPDPLGRCEAPDSPRHSVAVPIRRGVDFWSGPGFDGRDGPEVASCSARNSLVPESATVYQIDSKLGGPVQRFEPALRPVSRGTRVARALAPMAGGYTWSTPVDLHRGGGQRWRENWSPSLRVATVRLVGFDPPLAPDEQRPGAVAKPLDRTPAPRLCIEDPAFGPGCRWTCEDTTPGDGALAWPLLAGGACRNAGGAPETPLATPTYALDRLAIGVPPAPLRWSLVGSGWTQPWLEFELETTFMPAALRAEPAAADAGRLQVGRSGRAAFRVDNVGGQPIEVTTVEVVPGGAHAADFRVELPFAPVPLPLPLEIVPGEREASVLPAGPEAFPAIAVFQGLAHLRLAVAPQATLLQDGVAVQRRAGLSVRDVVDVRFSAKPQAPDALLPLALNTWALRRPPFVVQPGEAFDLSVLARPSVVGARQAQVRVRGRSTLDPSRTVEIVVVARARGLSGPRLSLAPATLSMHAPAAGERRERSILLVNDGDVAAAPGVPVLAAVGGAAPPQGMAFRLDLPEGGAGPLAPGASRLLRIAWLSRCLPGASGLVEERAELRWPTPDGTLVVPLRGATGCGP